MTYRIAALILMVLRMFFSAPQQKPPVNPDDQKDKNPVRLETAVVQLDAIVTDKTGRRVPGLTAADFVVLDNEQTQVVDFFATVEGTGSVKVSSTSPSRQVAVSTQLATAFPARFIGVVVDPLQLSKETAERVRRALMNFISTGLSPADFMSVSSTVGYLGGLQQFTNEKTRLTRAVDRISSLGTSGTPNNRFNLTPAEALRIDSGDTFMLGEVTRRVRIESPDAADMPEESLQNLLRTTSKGIVSELGQHIRVTLKTLESVFRSMAELPGRKVVVLVTEALISPAGSSEDASNDLLKVIDLARRSGVSVYALDAGGLRVGNVTAQQHITGVGLKARNETSGATFSDFETLGAARSIALATGGETILNTNNLEAGIHRAVEDSSAYYVVGFTPGALDNKFHRLTVTVKNRPDLIVRTRKGYLAVNTETARGTPTELAAALMSPITRTDLPLEVVANAVPKGEEQIVIAGLHIGHRYLTLPGAQDQSTSFDILAWLFAAGKDQPVGIVQRTITNDLGKDPQAREKLKKEGFVFVTSFTRLEPGSYQIRAAVREKSTGLVGSAFEFFEIPDSNNKKVVSASSLVLTAAGQAEFAGYNSFKPGSEIDVRFAIYNMPTDVVGPVQQMRLVDKQGKVLVDALIGASPRGTQLRGVRIQLPGTRGRYVLELVVKDQRGKIDIERRAELIVE